MGDSNQSMAYRPFVTKLKDKQDKRKKLRALREGLHRL